MIQSTLDYVVCPTCLNDLELNVERKVNGEVIEGKLTCTKCPCDYPIHGGLPILTPPGTKPYDWFARELTNALTQFKPREAIRMIAEGEIGPKRPVPNEPVLTPKELKEGKYKDSEKFLKDRFGSGSIEGAREHFRRVHDKDRKLFDTMISLGGLDKADMILDVGTGYGYMLQFLVEQFKSSVQIFSIGISYTNLKAVRGRFRIFGINHNIHLIVADALKPPFRNSQFDAVESFAGIGNIVGFCNIIGQANRILRDDGWFVADVPGGLERADKDIRALIDAVGLEFFVRNLRKLGLLPTSEEVIETMKKYGFPHISSGLVDSTHIISGRKQSN